MIEKILKNKGGKTRVIIAIAAAAAVLAACVPLVEWLYWTGFNALMSLWGVTERNIARAPWLVRQFARFSNVTLTLIQGGLLLACSRRLIRWKALEIPRETTRRAAFRQCLDGLAKGAGSVLALWLALLALDNVRLGRSLLRPAWSVNAIILPVTLAVFAAAAACWGVGLVFRFLESRMPWPAAAVIASPLLSLLLLDSAKIDAALVVNLLLCGAVCCDAARRTGSWAWAAGFVFGLWLLERALLGFPGYSAALYETYPVNYFWLNGGESGLWHSAALAFIMLCHLASLERRLPGRFASWFRRRRPESRGIRR
ncbi:MAG: hypothetical protein IKO07_02565 [Clostridia bacterium]|nr:hypothetical protein [Clostridia bacterium]